MAVTAAGVAAVLAWRRANQRLQNYPLVVQEAFNALKKHLSSVKGNIQLDIWEFDELTSTEEVAASAAVQLYGVVLEKDTTTASYTKLTDHATTSSDTASDITLLANNVGFQILLFPDGIDLANGLTLQGNTTADAGTGSSSDGCKGFLITGAA